MSVTGFCGGDDQRRDVLGQLVLVGGVVGQQDFRHARDLGRGVGDGLCAFAGDQHMDVAADLACGGDRVQRGGTERHVVVVGDDENVGHDQITRASVFSLSTRAATSATFTPALRLAGSTTFSVVRRGATSTPSASGVIVSSGFFFAFMMLGRDA